MLRYATVLFSALHERNNSGGIPLGEIDKVSSAQSLQMKIIIFLVSASIIGMVSTTGESSSHEDMKTCVYGKDQACNHALFLLWLLEKECVITIRSVYINLERLEEVFKRLSRSGRHHDYAMQKTRKHARCQVCATIDNPRIRNQRDCLIN